MEVTLEANPRTLLRRKLLRLRSCLGVNRVSLGAQTFQERLLVALGRFHRPPDVRAAVELCRDVGIESLNLDLIFAVPGQTEAELEADLDAVLALAPDHVSAYCLTFEAGTPLEAARARGEVRAPGEARAGGFFARVRRRLRERGYRHYEVSNFARPGHRCRHNAVYWRNHPYVGLGNGAASHLGGVRLTNHRDVRAYVEAIERGGGAAAVASREELPAERKVRETVFLALRTARGLDVPRFVRDTGVDPRAAFGAELARLQELGLVEARGERLRLTGRGVSVADAVAVELL